MGGIASAGSYCSVSVIYDSYFVLRETQSSLTEILEVFEIVMKLKRY